MYCGLGGREETNRSTSRRPDPSQQGWETQAGKHVPTSTLGLESKQTRKKRTRTRQSKRRIHTYDIAPQGKIDRYTRCRVQTKEHEGKGQQDIPNNQGNAHDARTTKSTPDSNAAICRMLQNHRKVMERYDALEEKPPARRRQRKSRWKKRTVQREKTLDTHAITTAENGRTVRSRGNHHDQRQSPPTAPRAATLRASHRYKHCKLVPK